MFVNWGSSIKNVRTLRAIKLDENLLWTNLHKYLDRKKVKNYDFLGRMNDSLTLK